MARFLESSRFGKRARVAGIAVIYLSCAVGTVFAVVRNPDERHLGTDMSPVQAAFIRYIFGLILLIPLLWRLGSAWLSAGAPVRARPHGGACRCVASCATFNGLGI